MLPLILLSCVNVLVKCETVVKPMQKLDYQDLMFSDTNHGDTPSQQVLYIDHGGGAVSQIRRTSFVPSASISHYQPKESFISRRSEDDSSNHIYDGSFADEPELNNHPISDIPRILQRRVGETRPKAQQKPLKKQRAPPSNEPPPQDPKIEPIYPKMDQKVPVKAEHPPPPPPPQNQLPPFFNFGQPDYFPFFDSPFSPPPVPNLFQRRRLAELNNNNVNDFHPNAIGYPSYTYYKGEENPSANNWPKIFKFTDGRVNLSDFEKQKKHEKIKFSSSDNYLDNISRVSFLILHGGTFSN